MASCVIVFRIEPQSWRDSKGFGFHTLLCFVHRKGADEPPARLSPAHGAAGPCWEHTLTATTMGLPWESCTPASLQCHQHPPMMAILRAWPSASSRAHPGHPHGGHSIRAPSHSSPSGTTHLTWPPLHNAMQVPLI